MTDLYSVLGIDKNADKDSIRKAYRKKAKKSHPDAKGSVEKFGALKKAHDILMDDVRRANYDATGDESEKSPDNTFSSAINCIAFHFNTVLMDCANSGTSPLVIDMISRLKAKINQNVQEMNKQLRITKGVLETDRKMQGRFNKKKASAGNVFSDILNNRIITLQANISTTEGNIKSHEDALNIIQEFSYKSDEAPYESSGDKIMRTVSYMGWP